jgi:hypothetical protein
MDISGETGNWIRMISQGATNSPAIRGYHSMLWDGTRVIMFGGITGTVPTAYRNDLWWYDPGNNTWTEKIALNAPGSPVSRSRHSMVWDGTRGIMFGGQMTSYRNDLWWYEPASNTWTEKITLNAPGSPVSRGYQTMVWDGTRVIMFGGSDTAGRKDDLWWYDPGSNTWTEKIPLNTPGSPVSRSYHSMVWDGTRVIMFGGLAVDEFGTSYRLNDLWWYNPGNNTWTQKIAQSTPGSPAPRSYPTMVWNGTKVIMFGGLAVDEFGTAYRPNDIWWYDPQNNQWTQYDSLGDAPAGRAYHTMIWDGTRGIMFGGNTGSYRNDLWWYNQ